MKRANRSDAAVSPIRLLLWLKIALAWRAYRNSRTKRWNIIIFLIAFVPISLLASFGVSWMMEDVAPATAALIVRDAFAVLFLIWILAPLIGYQLNESYDLTKLFVYPVGYNQILLGSFLGNLLDTPVLITLPPLGVLVWKISGDPFTALLATVAAGLFLLSTVALGQAITLALVGFLSSRRFRDITIVLFPLFGMAYYIAQQAFMRHLFHAPQRLINAPAWRVADWLPPGYASQALFALAEGRWAQAFGWTIALALWIAATLSVSSNTLKRLYQGDATRLPAQGGEVAAKPGRAEGGAANLLSRLPQDIAAVVGKELTYLVRDPQYKAMAVQRLYSLIAIAIPILVPSYQYGRHLPMHAYGGVAFIGVGSSLLLAMTPLAFNIFGSEGAAITVLFSLPTRRRSILIGKNLAHFVVMAILAVVGLGLVSTVTHRWSDLPLALLTVLISAPVLFAAGNLISVRLPQKMLMRGQRWQRGGTTGMGNGAGCLYSLAYMGAYLATIVTLIPVGAAVLVPEFLHAPLWLYLITIPLATLYAIALYLLILGTAEAWLSDREPEIAERIIPAD